MIITNLDSQTNATHPAFVACFSKSIISIIQDNITLYEVKIKVGLNWEEKRRPIVANGKSIVKFDLQYIARSIMQQSDMFGVLSIQSSNQRRSAIIDFEIIVTPDDGDTPFSHIISLPCFFGSYLVGQNIPKLREYLYYYTRADGVSVNQTINLPLVLNNDSLTTANSRVDGSSIGTFIRPYTSPMLNLFDYSYAKILIREAISMDNGCNLFIPTIGLVSETSRVEIWTEVKQTCGEIFRFINNRGMIRYVSLKITSKIEATKSNQLIKFDLFEQPISKDLSYIDSRIKMSTTTNTLKFVEQSIEEDFLPLYKDFCKSPFVQIAEVFNGNVFWRNVTLMNVNIKEKRKELLTDINVDVVIDSENNIF